MSDPAEIRWTVESDQIDPDRWARAILTALQGGNNVDDRQATRWGTWPAIVLIIILVVAVVALTGNWRVLIGFAPAALVIGAIFALSRNSVGRVAKQIRSTPSALEAFTFTADQSGTRSASTTGRDQLTWGRYRGVMLDDDMVLLTLDNKSVRVLPVAALSSGHSATHAVDTIKTWIDAAQSGH